jgi:hypothetical protein
VRKISAADGVIRSITLPVAQARVCGPRALAVDGAGNLFIDRIGLSAGAAAIIKVAPDGTSAIVSGSAGSLSIVTALAVDGVGNEYIADGNSRIQKLTPDGILGAIAGSQGPGFAGAL